MSTRRHSQMVIPLLLIGASLSALSASSAWGQQEASENALTPAPTMPEWLAPFPKARDQWASPASAEGSSAYTALAHPAEVISHYEQQMRTAGIVFSTRNDGIGVSIQASAERFSAVIRIREAENVTSVTVSYFVSHPVPQDQAAPVKAAQDDLPIPPSASPQPQNFSPYQSPVSHGTSNANNARRAPLSPYARVPYTWIMQSVIVRGSSPRKYTAGYYEAPSDRTVGTPLPLPAGASIVDVFPTDCLFSLQDQAGHSFTFQKAAEAMGKGLAPGTWSLYPMKCSGIDVFLK